MSKKDPTIDFEAWLRLSVEKMHQALGQYGIKQSKLSQSIVGEIIRNGQEAEQIIIKFAQYGRFVDMGVGRGMPIGSRKQLGEKQFSKKRNRGGQLHHYYRSPKPWFSKTKVREVARLRELLANHYAYKAMNEVESAFKAGA